MNNPTDQPTIERGKLLEFTREKIADAEKALRAREQGIEAWSSGTDESWNAVAKMHPSTATTPPITKAMRIENANRETRIAARCRREVEMFKAVYAALESK